jgi:hypothetical protein
MALAVEAPARDDMSCRTNDDKLVGARWLKSDGVTPVVVTSASLTLEFDLPPQTFDDAGLPLPRVAERHAITSTTPTDPLGWIDPTGLASGIVFVTIPHTIWSNYVMRTGIWDVVAVGEGVHRCLVRGTFVAQEGVST